MSRPALVFAAVLSIALVAAEAFAQTCAGALGASAGVASGEKFRLIAEQCDVLAEPLNVRRAAQLGLYERGAGMVAIPGAPLEPAPVPVAPRVTAPRTATPPGRDTQRIVTLAPTLTSAARAYDLDPLLLHAIAHVESRHNAEAVSKAGARGVMQVMPATAKRFGVNDPERTLHDAETNVRASAALLQTLFRRYGDDLRLVLAAYNAGEGAVDKFGRNVPPYPETQGYVRDVMAAHKRLASEFAVSADGNIAKR